MMILKISHSVDYNYWLKPLDTKLNNQPIKIQLEFPKLMSLQIRKKVL